MPPGCSPQGTLTLAGMLAVPRAGWGERATQPQLSVVRLLAPGIQVARLVNPAPHEAREGGQCFCLFVCFANTVPRNPHITISDVGVVLFWSIFGALTS